MNASEAWRSRRCRVRVAPSEKSLRARVFSPRLETRRSRRFGPCLLPLVLCSASRPEREHALTHGSGDTRSTLGRGRACRAPAMPSASRVHGPLQLRVPHGGCGARTTSASPRPAARAIALRHAGYSARSLREGRFQPGYQRQCAQKWVSHGVQRAARRAPAQRPLGARRGRAAATGLPNSAACRERALAGRWRARVRLGPVGSRATRAGRRGRVQCRAPARRSRGRASLDAVQVLGPRSTRCACGPPTLRGSRRIARRACVAAKATLRASWARQRASGARRARVSPRAPRAQQPAVRVDHRGVRAPRAPARLRVRSLSGSGLDPCCATVSPDAALRASSARALRARRRGHRAWQRGQGAACAARATRRLGEGGAADQRVAPAVARRRARPCRRSTRETCGALGARTRAARRCQRPRAA